MNILFRNAIIFDGHNFSTANSLRIQDGSIVELGVDLSLQSGEESIDCEGKWLLPGLVDCHVHFREPGLVRKEGYAYGSKGALHGGVTTVCEIQNNPPLMASDSLLRKKLEDLKGISHVDYAPYGSLVEDSLAHLSLMKDLCPAVKCFLGCSTGAGGVPDRATLKRWFAAAASAGVKVVAHCEDNKVMNAATEELKDKPELFSRHDLRRSVAAEVESIKEAIEVAIEVGCVLHVFHISTAEGGKLVLEAASQGHPITGTTAPHYLLVNAEEAHAINENRFKVNPSIKYVEDLEGLAEIISSRQLAGIGTDHAPHPLDEKQRPYSKSPSGFPSVDILLPLVVESARFHKKEMESFLYAVTAAPAEEFNLSRKGCLAPGFDADLVIADPDSNFVVDEKTLPSRSKWSPYHGRKLSAKPEKVFLRGNLVFDQGSVLGDAIGEPLFYE